MPVHLSLLIARMSTFTLAICLTTSNLPWFMDLTFQVPMQYCSLQHVTLLLSPVPSTTGCCFCFGSMPHSFWSYFSTNLQWHIGHLPTWGVHLSVSYLFAFSYCSWGSEGKNMEVVCHSLLQWTTFCQTSPPWPVSLGLGIIPWLLTLKETFCTCVGSPLSPNGGVGGAEIPSSFIQTGFCPSLSLPWLLP